METYRIPAGARMDRKTGKITPMYREGTAEEFMHTIAPLIRYGQALLRMDEEKARAQDGGIGRTETT